MSQKKHFKGYDVTAPNNLLISFRDNYPQTL